GGEGADTLSILGTSGNNSLSATFNGTSLTSLTGLSAINSIESITVDLAGGTDTLNYSTSSSGVEVNLETGEASGFTSITGIEKVTGSSSSDTLWGKSGVNNLLAGGGGNDTYHVSAGDTVVEGSDGGTDTVYSSGRSFTLSSNVENLTLEGAGVSGVGNSLANVMRGTGDANNLSGG